MSIFDKSKKQIASLASAASHACNCIGPQNGQPLCPCRMREVRIVDGRYVKTTDLGPAPNADNTLAKRFAAGGPLLCGDV